MCGLLSSMTLIIVLTSAGITAVIANSPMLRDAATLLAVAYMIWLAWRIATAPIIAGAASDQRAPGFMAGFGLNFINPKAYAAMAALFTGFQLNAEDPIHDAIAKGVLALTILAISDVAWIIAGGVLAPYMRQPRVGARHQPGIRVRIAAFCRISSNVLKMSARLP